MQGRRVGRYVLGPEIASGGMASVHLGRMLGRGGFGKTVAMKRLHAQYGRDPEFMTLFQDEARVTSALTHANIVMTLDVLEELDELYLVMEYVHGASLSQILRRLADQNPVPLRIGVGIIAAMLDGLHAAHEATDENGEALDIIHRDVSPQNVLVSFQGVAKIADFGISRAAGRVHSTGDGSVKGKISYMAPEQLLGTPLTAQTDIYAAGVVLWETITGRRLIDFDSMAENMRAVLDLAIAAPSELSVDVPHELDAVVMRAVERAPADRFVSARDMGTALRKATDVAHAAEIGDWRRAERPHLLEMREKSLAALQRAMGGPTGTAVGLGPPAPPQVGDENIAGEAETLTGRSDDGREGASREPSSNPSYWTGADLPPRARSLFPTLTILFALVLAGVLFAMTATKPSPAPFSPGASTSMAATVTSSASSPAPSGTSVAVTTATAASSAPVAMGADEPPALPRRGIRTAPTSSGTRPDSTGAAAASPSRKCRIVPSVDSAGHTKFTEVCR
ncbi:MAG: protein kinase [Myxococcales bacterium]|nr:protein kinase [Myxococcales bacterium]